MAAASLYKAVVAGLLALAMMVLSAGSHPSPLPIPGRPAPTAPIQLSSRFPRVQVPMTNRTAVLVTSGGFTNYPLYYFAPSITKDGRYLIYYHYDVNITRPPTPKPASGWYTVDGYDAILGLDYTTDQPGLLYRAGTVPSAEACHQLCQSNVRDVAGPRRGRSRCS